MLLYIGAAHLILQLQNSSTDPGPQISLIHSNPSDAWLFRPFSTFTVRTRCFGPAGQQDSSVKAKIYLKLLCCAAEPRDLFDWDH